MLYDHIRKLPKLSHYQIDSLLDPDVCIINSWISIMADAYSKVDTCAAYCNCTPISRKLTDEPDSPAAAPQTPDADSPHTPPTKEKRTVVRHASACSSVGSIGELNSVPPSSRADESPDAPPSSRADESPDAPPSSRADESPADAPPSSRADESPETIALKAMFMADDSDVASRVVGASEMFRETIPFFLYQK